MVGVTNVQLLQRRVPDLELQAFRCAGVIILCVVWMLVQQELPTIPLHDVSAVFLYGFLMTLSSTALYIGFALIPLTAAQCAEDTAGLLAGLIIFWMCGQEKFSFLRVLCVALCLVGVTLVVQPWHEHFQKSTLHTCRNNSRDCILELEKFCSLERKLDFKFSSTSCINHRKFPLSEAANPCEFIQTDCTTEKTHKFLEKKCTEWLSCLSVLADKEHHSITNGTNNNNKTRTKLFLLEIPQHYQTMLGIMFAALSGTTYSLVAAIFKKYPCVGENLLRSLFWPFLFGLTSCLALTFVTEAPVWPQSAYDSVLVFVHCLASVGVFVFYLYSLQHISGTTVNMIFCTSVVFLLVPQYTVLSSIMPGQRNWMEVVGVFLVLSGSVFVSVVEMFETAKNV